MTLRNYIIIVALGSIFTVRAQEEPAAPVFRPPFDFPLTLSGNFGELRSNHFHGGVDRLFLLLIPMDILQCMGMC